MQMKPLTTMMTISMGQKVVGHIIYWAQSMNFVMGIGMGATLQRLKSALAARGLAHVTCATPVKLSAFWRRQGLLPDFMRYMRDLHPRQKPGRITSPAWTNRHSRPVLRPHLAPRFLFQWRSLQS
jgi:hypothetical protein